MTETSSPLDAIRKEYGALTSTGSQTSTATPGARFDAVTRREGGLEQATRYGAAPKTGGDGDLAKLYGNLAACRATLARKVREYDDTHISLMEMLKPKDELYTRGQLFRMWYNEQLGRDKDVEELAAKYAGTHGRNISILMDRLIKIISENTETAKEMENAAKGIRDRTVAHWKYLGTAKIKYLQRGIYTERDIAQSEKQLKDLEKKVETFDNALEQYESLVKEARSKDDVPEVTRLTKEMEEVLTYKHQAFDQILQAQELSDAVKTSIMEAAEGVQAAKANLAVVRTTYKTIVEQRMAQRLIVMKYESMKTMMVPNLRLQAETAALQMGSKELFGLIRDSAEIMQQMVKGTAEYAMVAYEQASNLMKDPMVNEAELNELSATLAAHKKQIEQRDLAWAQSQLSVVNQAQADLRQQTEAGFSLPR